jgi:hypothetical protein
MDRTESTVRKMLTAIEAPLYDIGVLSDRGMLPGLDSIPAAAVLDRLSLLKPATPAARTSTSALRVSTASPRSTISTRPRLRGSLPMASPHVLLSRPVPATFKPGSSTREYLRSSSEPLPRRHCPIGTTLTLARRAGGGLDGSPALPIANRNTESRTASSLSCACTATAGNSTRWLTASSPVFSGVNGLKVLAAVRAWVRISGLSIPVITTDTGWDSP